MKTLMVRVGLWLALRGGWRPAPPTPPCTRAHLPDDHQVELAKRIVADIAERYPSADGGQRRRSALLALMNIRPEARERDLNLLIELGLQD